MINWLNHISAAWANYFLLMSVQNLLFLTGILGLLYLCRNQSAKFLRALTMLGLLKLVIPPFLFSGYTSQIGAWYSDVIQVIPGVQNFATASPAHLSITSMFLITFVLGCTVLFVGIVRKYLRFSRISLRLAGETGLPGFEQIPVYVSEDISSPRLIGIFKPKIVVTPHWEYLSMAQKRSVLAHEIAHIRQWDPYITVLQMMATILHFYNPLVWIINRQINYYSEMACDDLAVESNTIGREEYSQHLLQVASNGVSHRESIMPGWGFAESFDWLKSRIQYQVEVVLPSRSKLRKSQFALIIILSMAIVPLSCNMVDKTSDTATKQSMTQSKEVPPPPAPAAKDLKPFDTPPTLIGGIQSLRKNIHYPEIALKAGIEGKVLLKVRIDESGHITTTEIVKGIERGGLNEAAMEAVKNTTWNPAKQDGKPVSVWYHIPIVFRLPEKGADK